MQISASDLDLAENGQVFFYLDNSTDFEINVTSGVLQSLRAFDYEAEQSFILRITAMDNTSIPLSDSVPLTIFISDINDNFPFFVDFPFNGSFSEATPLGSPIASIDADDIDSGVNSEVNIFIRLYSCKCRNACSDLLSYFLSYSWYFSWQMMKENFL